MAETIQVTTELLQQKGEEWKAVLKQILGEAEQTEEITGTLEKGLKAEFMQLFVQKFLKQQEEIKGCIMRITAQVEKLGEIGETYNSTERSNTITDGED